VPSPRPATQMLRDSIVVTLRTAGQPMSASQLRSRAPALYVAGAAAPLPPIREQVYRALLGLLRHGLVERMPCDGRAVMWALTAAGTAADEIAQLEESLAVPAADAVMALGPRASVTAAAQDHRSCGDADQPC